MSQIRFSSATGVCRVSESHLVFTTGVRRVSESHSSPATGMCRVSESHLSPTTGVCRMSEKFTCVMKCILLCDIVVYSHTLHACRSRQKKSLGRQQHCALTPTSGASSRRHQWSAGARRCVCVGNQKFLCILSHSITCIFSHPTTRGACSPPARAGVCV